MGRRSEVKSTSGVGRRKSGILSSGLVTERKSIKRLAKEDEELKAKRVAAISVLSPSLQAAMNQTAMDIGTLAADDVAEQDNGGPSLWMDIGDDDDDDDGDLLEISHEGGEYMDAVEVAMEDVIPARPSVRAVRSTVASSTRERRQQTHSDWTNQVHSLSQVFLHWRYHLSQFNGEDKG